jgi:hypothetical protein
MKLFSGLLTFAFALETTDQVEIPDNVLVSNGLEVGKAVDLTPRPFGTDIENDRRSLEDRRYADLSAMGLKLWAVNGHFGDEKFDDRKYWTYGCHCLFLGDRPMSQGRFTIFVTINFFIGETPTAKLSTNF